MLASDLGITSVLQVVQRTFGIEGSERGDEYDMLCPHPAHDDATPSASVNLDSGLWHCFSCARGGDIIGLGTLVLRKQRDDVEEMLRPNTPDALRAILAGKLMAVQRTPRIKALAVPSVSSYPSGPLDLLRFRGFKTATLNRWDVRYVPQQKLQGKAKEFSIYASIGIPIEDERGRVLFWCYRRTDASPSWQPRYLYSPGSEGLVRETWFGLQHHARQQDIVIVEGALDAMWADQCGIPALAMLGSGVSERKLRQLQTFRSVTMLGDWDAGGAAAVAAVGHALGHLVPLRVCTYSRWMGARDPQELAPVDLELVVARARPWASWLLERQRVETG